MRLDSAHIRNFKLVEDVDLRFSQDPAHPLTVIRAENGSGKTSILLALRWAMWGNQGIPTGMPLTSTASPAGEPVNVQVRIDFTERDRYSGTETRYRLIRSCVETRGEGDDFERTDDRERLLLLTDQGDKDVEEGRRGLISAMLPLTLADVFFTDGDAVQNFISGIDQSQRERQEYVHKAIRQLLGFDDVEAAERVVKNVHQRFVRNLRESGSERLKNAEAKREGIAKQIDAQKQEQDRVVARIDGVDRQIREDDRELDRIKGIGDLEAIQARIRELNSDIHHLELEETNLRQQMKGLLQSEQLSTRMLADKLRVGIDVLTELENRHVIPGTSIGLLHDRLDLGTCICGEELIAGDERHAHIIGLIEEHQRTEPSVQRLTELRWEARTIPGGAEHAGDTDTRFSELIQNIKNQFTECKDRQRRKEGDRKAEEDRRSQIKEEKVQTLTQRLQSNRAKKSEYDRERGKIERDLQELEELLKQQQDVVADAERQEQLSSAALRRAQVANDMVTLTTGILELLKSDHVERVSERMGQLFMDIVGADPTSDSNLFSGVNIVSGTYDVIVNAQGGRTLDVVTDLNGASKRALTFSLIWALMEVADKEAPRIIDSPLGMTAGAVKQRMVELLTPPVDSDGLPYQVVLFMTGSEIRDIEPLIQARAGVVTTLTCSKDYPIDLVNDWGIDHPVVRTCECDHTQFCRLCERRNSRGRLRQREDSLAA